MSDTPEISLVERPAPDQTKTPTNDTPEVGRWYLVKDNDKPRWLGCVTHLGSNYARLDGVQADGTQVNQRIHFDEFWQLCEYVPDPQPIIDEHLMGARKRVGELMNEIKALTARLGVGQHQAIGAVDSETQAVAVRSGEPVEEYKTALIKAKEETLPDLFGKLKKENATLAGWMHTQLIPLQAQIGSLKELTGAVEDRIFNVELYAGLCENVKQVRKGKPAAVGEKVRLLQRRCYMDEECLANYQHGGMDFHDIGDFDKWFAKPENFKRVLPFERCAVAFQVRRYDKQREAHSLFQAFVNIREREYDKWTFLYIRNGEQLHRMDTKLEFGEQLFPDANHKIFTARKLWAKIFAHDVDDLITDDDYQMRVADDEKHAKWVKTLPKKDRWTKERHSCTKDDYIPFTPETVHYDDIMEVINETAKKHNRIALILQGLLDRSSVFHPHPPWQLWTAEGFEAAVERVFDDSRALSAGDKPDFEKYRAELNARLTEGSLTVGQEIAWEVREAKKENERRARDYRHRDEYGYDRDRFHPDGDPGPGTLAYVHQYDGTKRACTYVWKRQKRGRSGYAIRGTEVVATLTTGEENVLNVDAYKPGDYHIFFDDPRTRQEYLKWAPLLLEAEECHAGNRELKPQRRLAPLGEREPVVRTEERPMSLKEPPPPKPRPPVGEKWKGKTVRLLYSTETQGGTKFKAGELLKVDWYERKTLTLTALKGKDRRIRLRTHAVEIVDDPTP